MIQWGFVKISIYLIEKKFLHTGKRWRICGGGRRNMEINGKKFLKYFGHDSIVPQCTILGGSELQSEHVIPLGFLTKLKTIPSSWWTTVYPMFSV